GYSDQCARLLEAMTSQVRIMINARLHPTTAQVHLAEDLLQETMLALSTGLASLQRRTAAGIRAFASTIVSRRVADALRDRQRIDGRPRARSLDSTMHGDLSADGPLWTFLSATGASPLTQADAADRFLRMMGELQRLNPEHREIITLAFFDQLETGDIAQGMGIS